jgi:hypothetical protein
MSKSVKRESEFRLAAARRAFPIEIHCLRALCKHGLSRSFQLKVAQAVCCKHSQVVGVTRQKIQSIEI